MDRCEKHNVELECLAGCSAHPDNWYCPECKKEPMDIETAIKRIRDLESQLHMAEETIEGRYEKYMSVLQENINLKDRIEGLKLLTINDGKEIGSYVDGTGLRGENRDLRLELSKLEASDDLRCHTKAMEEQRKVGFREGALYAVRIITDLGNTLATGNIMYRTFGKRILTIAKAIKKEVT